MPLHSERDFKSEPWFQDWVSREVAKFGEDRPTAPRAKRRAPLLVLASKRDGSIRSAYVSGVYYLYAGRVLQYIGQSGNVYARLAQHMAHASFDFDSFSVEECEPRVRLKLEAAAIRKHMPRGNRDIPAHGIHPATYQGPHPHRWAAKK